MPRTAAVYAAILALGTALFFFLHWVGDLTPYETVRQRLEDEVAVNAGAADERYFDGAKKLFRTEFSHIALMALAGGRRDDSEYHPIMNSIIPRTYNKGSKTWRGVFWEVMSSEDADADSYAPPRYWYGNKAALAIGLRLLSVFEYHRLILLATFGAWIALAAALAALGWRALIVGAPVVVLGIWMSGIVYFADAQNGPATAWAVWSAAILALMMRWRTTARRAPMFCFAAGMVSSYLWFFDGHNAIAVFLLGLAAWLGCSRLKASDRARRSAGCAALWVLGFAACMALGTAVKIAALEWNPRYYPDGDKVETRIFQIAALRLERAVQETLAGVTGDGFVIGCPGCGDETWQRFPVARDIRGLWIMTSLAESEYRALLAFSAAALVAAAGIAAWRAALGTIQNNRAQGGRIAAWRADLRPLHAVLWIAALTLLAAVHLFLPSDVPFRNARLAFIPLAACWVCLAAAAAESERKEAWAAAACLALFAAGGVWLAHPVSVRALEREIAGEIPAVRSEFDVYLSEDAKRLIYRSDDCDDSDAEREFFLETFPADADDLPARMRKSGFESAIFGGRFNLSREHGWERISSRGGRCLFERDLPNYPIVRLATGQTADGAELWRAEIKDVSLPKGEPTARGGVFDIYMDENRLIYFAKDCEESDTRGRFFLSVFPARAADLSRESLERGLAHNSLNFAFERHGAVWDGKCLAYRVLPGYEISAIETGQFAPGEGELWRAVVSEDSVVPDMEPTARGGVFDIYMDENRLIYFAKDCEESDTRGRFFLSVFPARAADLSRESRERGLAHDTLNFDFERRVGVEDGECATVRALPDYEISAIETGQFAPGEGELWKAVVLEDSVVPDMEPTARGGIFDIYLDEGRLIYFAKDCAESDTRGRFFLSVFPARAADLSRESRERGFFHNSLNFDFERRGGVDDGECATVRVLPDYEISAIETGQFVRGEGELWKVRIER